jgi:predicted permease
MAGSVVMGAFGLILLMACANLAHLFLARATLRHREIALYLALGASRARVIQQLVTESVLISIVGSALGSVLALWSFQALVARALPSFSPPGIPPMVLNASPDIRVLSFAVLLAVATGLLFGLAPAMRVSKPDLQGVLKQDATGAGGHPGRFQGPLVGVQVAVCMVLMVAAGLFLRALLATQTIDPGFASRNVTVAAYDLASVGYDLERGFALQRRLVEQLEATPDVEMVAHAQPPLSGDSSSVRIRLSGQDVREAHFGQFNSVSGSYFSLIGIPIVRGRTFTAAESVNDARVAIVTEATARNLWPGRDPIGETLVWSMTEGQDITAQVVGVTGDAQVTSPGQIDPYYLYLPATPRSLPYLALLVRSRASFASSSSTIRSTLRALDSGVAVRNYSTQLSFEQIKIR